MKIEVTMPEIKKPVRQYCPECEYDYTWFSDPDQPQCDECTTWENSNNKRVKVCLPMLAILIMTWVGLEIFCGLSAGWRILLAVSFIVIFAIPLPGFGAATEPNANSDCDGCDGYGNPGDCNTCSIAKKFRKY